MNDQTDSQLLRAYAEHRSEPAFTQLVHRHLDFVYSAALRMVCDSHLAQDVTQSVFVALAKNAHQLFERPVLSGWLHRTAQNIAAQTVRTDVRRRAREQEAATMNELLAHETDASWKNIAPHLDTALGELSEPDRDALLLRYFERKSAREMAGVLNVSEEAAQKRVNRAVDRLREVFSKRNVTIGSSGLVVLISTNAVQAAPIGLITIISSAISLAGTTVQTSTAIVATKTIAMTTLQKSLIAATISVAVATAIHEARQASRLRAQIETIQQQGMRSALSNEMVLSNLRDKIDSLSAQNGRLTSALAQADADKARLETEREQAKRSVALFKELADQDNFRDKNLTNDYPTARHVWAGFGRLGRLSARLSKEESKLSQEEKSANDAARLTGLGEVAILMKAMQQLELDDPSAADFPKDDPTDTLACLYYGALNLDELQFGEIYGLLEKYRQRAEEKNPLTRELSPDKAGGLKQIMEQINGGIRSILTSEQVAIFEEIQPYIEVVPGKLNFKADFKFDR